MNSTVQEVVFNSFEKVHSYFQGAGLREFLLFGGGILLVGALFFLVSLWFDKKEGDFRHALLLLFFGVVAFVVLFAVFFWLEINHWEPVLQHLG